MTDYVSQTTQPNKIPKLIRTENNNNKDVNNKFTSQNQVLSKIIKSSNTKINPQEKFMTINK